MSSRLLEETVLSDDMNGVFVVSTADRTEVRLDLDAHTVCTFATAGSSAFSRRDREPVELVLLATCRVGEPLVMLINLRIPGIWFTRRTTEPITRIVRTEIHE
jgi:hypothetical protein